MKIKLRSSLSVGLERIGRRLLKLLWRTASQILTSHVNAQSPLQSIHFFSILCCQWFVIVDRFRIVVQLTSARALEQFCIFSAFYSSM